jgi:uncharacterized membrane protein
MPKNTSNKRTLGKVLPYLYVVLGVIGLVAAFVIMYDKLRILQDPSYRPSCSINPIISCGSVMRSSQSHIIFGFPNPILGLIGFPVVITIGMALLAGATFRRWFWRGLELGALLGVIFISWLAFESIYRIQALCPYCMAVWSVTIPIFWYTTLYNLRAKNLPTPRKLRSLVAFAQKHHGEILTVWYLIIIVLILNHFWYYWQTLI